MADKQIANFCNWITESTGTVVSSVKQNDLKKASRSLTEIKSDGAMLVKKLKLHVEQLESLVKLNINKERETKEQLYQAERDQKSLQRENDEIKYQMEQCKKALSSTTQSLQHSEYLYECAEMERREKGKKAQEVRDNWFVPIWGQFLMIREAIQKNGEKEEIARREAARHRENCRSLEREIANYENELRISSNKIDANQRSINALSDKCNKLHRQTGDFRNAIADLKESIFSREEQSSIAVEGLDKTDNLDKKFTTAIGFKAEKQNRFCQSNATERSIALFTETWNSIFTIETTSKLTISFTCISCGCFKTDIPFYNESNKSFTCGDCYEKQQT